MNAETLAKLPPEELLHAYDEAEASMRTLARKRRALTEIVRAGELAEAIRDEILRRLKEDEA